MADPNLGWDGGNSNSGKSSKKAVHGSTSLPRTAFQHSQRILLTGPGGAAILSTTASAPSLAIMS